MSKTTIAAAFAMAAISLSTFVGCQSSNSGVVFGHDEALHAQSISTGTVTDVRAGVIEGEKSPIGAIAGGIAGAAVGNLFGGGKGNTLATVAGGLGGAAAGAAIEKGVTTKNGLQITVQLDNGQTLVIVQEADTMFSVGQRVRVISGGAAGKDRVQPL